MRIFRFLIILSFIFTISAIIFSSCKHGCGGEGGTSTHNEDHSHNMGLNCMNCHSGTGDGSGCFAVAGTIYKGDKKSELPNATVKLYSDTMGSGTLIRTIEVDKLGNFYDGKTEGLPGSFFPVVISPSGTQKFMLEPISTGACNSCHGKSTDRIWVD